MYGVPVILYTTSPSNPNARFEYLKAESCGMTIPVSGSLSSISSRLGKWRSFQPCVGDSVTKPERWVNNRRSVTPSTSPRIARAEANSGMCCASGSSNLSWPASRNCIIAVVVNVLVTEATRAIVLAVGFLPESRSAAPNPPNQASSRSRIMPSAMPGSLYLATVVAAKRSMSGIKVWRTQSAICNCNLSTVAAVLYA